MPGASIKSNGPTAAGSESGAELPSGALRIDQWNVRGSPLMSVDALPSSVTDVPTGAVRSRPAFAIGAELPVAMTTVSGALSDWPSFTIRRTTYSPGLSAMNVGRTAVGSERMGLLPTGALANDHRKVSRSPSASLEMLPSRLTAPPDATV